MPNETIEEWEDKFLDFYWERGEYNFRQLGPAEYIEFIRTLLKAERVKGREEMLNIIQKEEGWEESYEHYKKFIKI